MCGRLANDKQNSQRIDDWLLALLRFAITRDTVDRTAATDLATKRTATRSATFFVRTTADVCQAIVRANDLRRVLILRSHLARIENPRLRRRLALRHPPLRDCCKHQGANTCGRARRPLRAANPQTSDGRVPSWSQFICRLCKGLAIRLDCLRRLEPYFMRAYQYGAWRCEVLRTRYRFAARLRRADAGSSRQNRRVRPIPRRTGCSFKSARRSLPHCQSLSSATFLQSGWAVDAL